MANYTVCKKCGHRHSTLVKHKCFTAKKQEKPPKLDPKDHDPSDRGGETESLDEHGETGSEDSGDDREEGEEGEGKGEGEEAEGEGEGEEDGEGDGQGETEAPAPQPPEPEARPEAVICSVLKYAALCAQCAKNGLVMVELTEDGLFVYGHNSDISASATMPWGEFEKRSTLDGQFYVKEIIDGVDNGLLEKEKLTLPLKAGQWVRLRDGRIVKVSKIVGTDDRAIAMMDGGPAVFADTGKANRVNIDTDGDAVANSSEPKTTKTETEEAPKAKADNSKPWKMTKPKVGDCFPTNGGAIAKVNRVTSPWPRNDDATAFGTNLGSYNRNGQWVRSDYGSHCDADIVGPAKGLITLPLTVGQRVVKADGTIVTVEKVAPNKDEADIAHYTDGVVVYAATGRTDDDGVNGDMTADLGGPEIHNAICDAE